MQGRARHAWQTPLAIVGAIGVTVLFVWLLAWLNVAAIAKLPEVANTPSVIIQGPQTDAIRQSDTSEAPQPEVPQPEVPQPEVMIVELDMPTLELKPEPLDLRFDIPNPEIDPIRVAVRTAPTETVPPQPSPNPDPIETASRPTVHRADRVDQPPREATGNAKPIYPAREESLGIEGTVKMRLMIDERGRVEDVQFLSGAQVFRDALRKVAVHWRYSPARHRGKPVKVWGVKEVRFTNRRGRN